MPSNEERREMAKLNLERQLESRAQKDRQRRIFTVAGAVVAIAAAAAAIVTFVMNDKESDPISAAPTSAAPTTPPPRGGADQLPTFAASADLGANCQYPAAQKASRPVDAPKSGKVPTDPATISVSKKHISCCGGHHQKRRNRRTAIRRLVRSPLHFRFGCVE